MSCVLVLTQCVFHSDPYIFTGTRKKTHKPSSLLVTKWQRATSVEKNVDMSNWNRKKMLRMKANSVTDFQIQITFHFIQSDTLHRTKKQLEKKNVWIVFRKYICGVCVHFSWCSTPLMILFIPHFMFLFGFIIYFFLKMKKKGYFGIDCIVPVQRTVRFIACPMYVRTHEHTNTTRSSKCKQKYQF